MSISDMPILIYCSSWYKNWFKINFTNMVKWYKMVSLKDGLFLLVFAACWMNICWCQDNYLGVCNWKLENNYYIPFKIPQNQNKLHSSPKKPKIIFLNANLEHKKWLRNHIDCCFYFQTCMLAACPTNCAVRSSNLRGMNDLNFRERKKSDKNNLWLQTGDVKMETTEKRRALSIMSNRFLCL